MSCLCHASRLVALVALLPVALAACPAPRGVTAGPGAAPAPPTKPAAPSAAASAPASAPTSAPTAASAPTSAPAKVRVSKPILPTGSLSRADIMQVVRRNLRAVRSCYERELAKQPTLSGRLLVSMVVQEDGSVREAVVEHSSFNQPQLDACVVKRISAWRFPRPRGGLVVIKYPFVFRTSTP